MYRGFKTVFSPNREALKSNESQHSIFQQEKNKKAPKWSIKRDLFSWAHVLKTFTLKELTTDSIVVLKTGYRQTDKSFLHRLIDSILSV